MSKLIAVCGSPASGKTTAALKIAQEIYFGCKTPIMFLSADLNIPTLAYLFPRLKDSELFSLGMALDKTTITCEDVLGQTVGAKSMKDFGFLGFKAGENRYSYPTPTEDKVRELFAACKDIAPFVFVDCATNFDDPISEMAIREADIVIQIIVPDLRSMGYYSSYQERYDTVSDKCIKVISLLDNDLFLPIDEVKAHFKDVRYVLPYSRPLKQQAITGTLTERISDSKYRAACGNIVKAVLSK